MNWPRLRLALVAGVSCCDVGWPGPTTSKHLRRVVFGLAGVVLVAYVGSRFGVLAEAARLLTA
jgi:hypothetical protein